MTTQVSEILPAAPASLCQVHLSRVTNCARGNGRGHAGGRRGGSRGGRPRLMALPLPRRAASCPPGPRWPPPAPPPPQQRAHRRSDRDPETQEREALVGCLPPARRPGAGPTALCRSGRRPGQRSHRPGRLLCLTQFLQAQSRRRRPSDWLPTEVAPHLIKFH